MKKFQAVADVPRKHSQYTYDQMNVSDHAHTTRSPIWMKMRKEYLKLQHCQHLSTAAKTCPKDGKALTPLVIYEQLYHH